MRLPLQKYGFGVDKISSHYESYLAGYGSGHGDPHNWLKPFGKTMDWFRAEVQKLLNAQPATPTRPDTGKVLYRVQTGAFSVKANADKLAAELKGKGFDTYIVQVDGLYKVQVGAYSVRANADAMAAKLTAAGYKNFITTKSGTAAAPSAPAKRATPRLPVRLSRANGVTVQHANRNLRRPAMIIQPYKPR